MNSDFNEFELVDNDSVFIANPKKYFDEIEWRGRLSRLKVIYLIMVVYGISIFSMYWFIWQPAIFKEGTASFYHSPTFFFIVVWIVVTILPILFCLQSMWKSTLKTRRIIIETKEIARRTYYLENSIREENVNQKQD